MQVRCWQVAIALTHSLGWEHSPAVGSPSLVPPVVVVGSGGSSWMHAPSASAPASPKRRRLRVIEVTPKVP